MGIDVGNGFAPMYVELQAKAEIIERLRDSLDSSTELVLATDEDREGEAISWHLLEVGLSVRPGLT